MKKIISFAWIIFLVFGCTSDVEKAKQLGFSNVAEMVTLNEMGYKSYAEFEKAHPFVTVDTSTTRFAGVELGKEALKYGQRIETLEFPQMYKTIKDVYISTSWGNENVVERITFMCDKSKAETIKLGSIDCSSTEADLKALNLKVLCNVFNEINPEDPFFYIKDRAFFATDSNRNVVWIGIATDDYFEKKWTGGEFASKLIPCEQVSSWKRRAEIGNFKNIYEMYEAHEKGIVNSDDWKLQKAADQFDVYKNNLSGPFEKALVLYSSTSEEFDQFKDSGGFKFDDKWRGYIVESVEVGFKKRKLDWYILNVEDGYGVRNKKLASLNNIKQDLSRECGSEWLRIRVADDTGFKASNEFASCRIYRNKDGGVTIEVMSSLKN